MMYQQLENSAPLIQYKSQENREGRMLQKKGGEEEDCPPMRVGRSIQCSQKKILSQTNNGCA
jgi:hypothetical protein